MKQRVVDGHLDDCGLTFGDLKKIRNSFIKTLKSIHHNRIAYPSHNPEAKIEKNAFSDVSVREKEEKAVKRKVKAKPFLKSWSCPMPEPFKRENPRKRR